MNIAFYVSGRASRLKLLLNMRSEVIDKTVLVITDSPYVLDMAIELEAYGVGLKYFDYEQRKFANEKQLNFKLSEFILNEFRNFNIDYCFCFGDHVLKGDLLTFYKYRIINFHPSILPLFPGRLAIDQAAKDSKTILLGNTAHFVDEGVDTGPVIIQSIISKSKFNGANYNVVLDLQIEMLESIYSALLKDDLVIIDNCVFWRKIHISKPGFYYNIIE